MNEVAKLYQLVVNRELAKSKNEVLDVVRIKKLLLYSNDIQDFILGCR